MGDTNVAETQGAPAPEIPGGTPANVDPAVAAPVEGAPAGDAKPPEPAAPEIPEETLKAAAEKYAAAKVQAANKTMAAARRAEKAVETAKGELTAAKTDLANHQGFVAQFYKSPTSAIARLNIGDGSVKAFIEHIRDTDGGGEQAKAETLEEKVARLEQERKDERDGGAQAAQKARVEESKRKVFEAVDKDARFDLAATDIGHSLLWEAIEEYAALHGGQCPDAAVFALAAHVETHLETNVSKSKKFSGQRPAATQNGATPANQAANAGTNGGTKTLTNGSTAGAPATRVYSLDPDERRKQVTDDMRANGEL